MVKNEGKITSEVSEGPGGLGLNVDVLGGAENVGDGVDQGNLHEELNLKLPKTDTKRTELLGVSIITVEK